MRTEPADPFLVLFFTAFAESAAAPDTLRRASLDAIDAARIERHIERNFSDIRKRPLEAPDRILGNAATGDE
jgi:hypothetical protein